MKSYNSNYFTIYHPIYKLLAVFICCFFLACVKQNNTKQVLPLVSQPLKSETAINLNTASAAELEKLPHVGEKLARAIIKHRAAYGKFRKAEHLLLVDGISEKRFREMETLIRVE